MLTILRSALYPYLMIMQAAPFGISSHVYRYLLPMLVSHAAFPVELVHSIPFARLRVSWKSLCS